MLQSGRRSDFHIQPAYGDLESLRLTKGRFLNETDINDYRKVAVVGRVVEEADRELLCARTVGELHPEDGRRRPGIRVRAEVQEVVLVDQVPVPQPLKVADPRIGAIVPHDLAFGIQTQEEPVPLAKRRVARSGRRRRSRICAGRTAPLRRTKRG